MILGDSGCHRVYQIKSARLFEVLRLMELIGKREIASLLQVMLHYSPLMSLPATMVIFMTLLVMTSVTFMEISAFKA